MLSAASIATARALSVPFGITMPSELKVPSSEPSCLYRTIAKSLLWAPWTDAPTATILPFESMATSFA